MEILFQFSIIALTLFMILAFYDGVYLHLWKYQLFNQEASLFEHKVHTIRSILFPTTAWLLFVCSDKFCFIFGMILMLLDLLILSIDAYVEADSRSFMGGLPRWEYIIHLFANSLHFTSFILIILTRIKINDSTFNYTSDFINTEIFNFTQNLVQNLLPGAFAIGILHLLLSTKFGIKNWISLKAFVSSH